eukprot:6175426-Pleurochrysis_carterae.AAC.7
MGCQPPLSKLRRSCTESDIQAVRAAGGTANATFTQLSQHRLHSSPCPCAKFEWPVYKTAG